MCKAKNAKNGISIKHLDLCSYIHELIYLVSVSPGENLKNVYKSILLYLFVSDKKGAKNGTYAKLLLIVCSVTTPRQLGLKGSNFQDLMEVTLGAL